ncbi:T9SS type A sorting domain-containing protein [Psychroserpens damuponensis]|uniref:T9SS type A sorting domain-containing protein n=1 Tax=Psychroserpens damuponensis TaxID=943936 RepID=UPI000ADCA8BC|nr:T9SS type A sorting domain-containing protein [Psychroserpens damuponensis]
MYLLYLITSLAFISLNAQDCTIGNTIVNNDGSGNFSNSNLLSGVKFTLTEEGLLNSINMIGNNTGAQVQMAIYNDNNGEPDALIATSEIGVVTEGLVTLSAPNYRLLVGDYWVFAIFDENGIHTPFAAIGSPRSQVYRQGHVFGNPMPNRGSAFVTYGSELALPYFVDLTCSSSTPSACNIGNSEVTPEFTGGNNFVANVLLSSKKVTLTESGTLNSINMIGNGTGAQVQMALYDDENGVPNNLIATSSVGAVIGGHIALPVTPITLPASDYWIMAVYDTDGDHVLKNENARDSRLYYQSVTFGDTMPVNASGFFDFGGADYLYYLDISCSTLSNDDFNINDTLSLFPNPSSTNIFIRGLKQREAYVMYNTLGEKVLEGYIEKHESINVASIKTGLYFVKLNSGQSLKFIKD